MNNKDIDGQPITQLQLFADLIEKMYLGTKETIADLKTIPALLLKRGYSHVDVENIMNKNWINFLRKAWSK